MKCSSFLFLLLACPAAFGQNHQRENYYLAHAGITIIGFNAVGFSLSNEIIRSYNRLFAMGGRISSDFAISTDGPFSTTINLSSIDFKFFCSMVKTSRQLLLLGIGSRAGYFRINSSPEDDLIRQGGKTYVLNKTTDGFHLVHGVLAFRYNFLISKKLSSGFSLEYSSNLSSKQENLEQLTIGISICRRI